MPYFCRAVDFTTLICSLKPPLTGVGFTLAAFFSSYYAPNSSWYFNVTVRLPGETLTALLCERPGNSIWYPKQAGLGTWQKRSAKYRRASPIEYFPGANLAVNTPR